MDSNTDYIRGELDRLCAEIAPSKVISDIGDYQSEHFERVLRDYGRFISQFELYFEQITDMFRAVNYIDKMGWPKHRSVQYLLVVHNLKSLYSSFDRLIHGFYEDSSILSRPVYEAFVK